MNTLQFQHIPFSQNILAELAQAGADNSLYIFPTEAGKRAAIREFQSKWAFQNIRFLTMEELKELVFETDRPLLKEEKRFLAFYSTLTESDKQFFKIGNYFQSIELAHNFFELWGEFNEELVAEDFPARLAATETDLLPWQKESYERLIRIKKNYQKLLAHKGFADAIFAWEPAHLSLAALADFTSVFFINQFYYTGLEKRIIQQLLGNGAAVTLFYQLPENLVEKETLAIRPFSVADLGEGRVEGISIIECKNDFTMLRALVEEIDRQKLRHVVNFSAHQNPQARLLSPLAFHLGGSLNFTATSIFHFFQITQKLLESLILEESRQKLLLPLQEVLNALCHDNFCRVFFADENERLAALNYLYELISWDYKFFDLDGQFLNNQKKNPAAAQHIQQILKFTNSLLSIDSITALLKRIDAEPVLIDKILTLQEKETTNLRETFYRALADFYALERINLVEKWPGLFTNRRIAPAAQLAAGFMQLFLDYLKYRTVRVNLAVETPRVEFTTLQDTRNLVYKNVAVMNVVEKEIPPPRQTPFLFTERQRRLLGLKTYDDIKLREKYYFMRLVLTTPHITLLTQRNIEQNIDVSSFVEELRVYLPDKVRTVAQTTENYAAIYDLLLKPERGYRVNDTPVKKAEFYAIPWQPQRDFPHKSLNLSYYALSGLLGNAFSFYLRHVIRLEEHNKRAATDFTSLLIGNIVHDSLNNIWRALLETQVLPPVQIDFKNIPDKIIDNAVRKTLHLDRFYYASTHNHAAVYFAEIVLPRCKQGFRQFFNYLDRLGLSNKPLDIFPEKDEIMLRDAYLPYITFDDGAFAINIGGRADLRIEAWSPSGVEAPDVHQYYIFDYKTGGYDRDQLVLYELYYYLIEGKVPPAQVFSYFYQVLDADGTELRDFARRKSKEEIFAEFQQNVREQVNKLRQNGFFLPEKKDKLPDMAGISRSDLYRTNYLPLVYRNRLL